MIKNIFSGFALAVSMLSILPFFKVHDFYKGINGYAVMFYPLVGLLLGSILWGISIVLEPYIPSTHLGIIIFALWVLITGALHLDGLSDTIDGLYVHRDRALEVMKDPHTGGMGMIFTVVFLILKASTLAIFEAFYLLPLVLMLSRFNAVVSIYIYPYITQNGIGSLAKSELNGYQVLTSAFYVISITLFFFIPLLFVSLFVMYVIKYIFIRRYGGFSGDIYGFMIEVTELVLLNIILVWFVVNGPLF